jgi:hypothetical protein
VFVVFAVLALVAAVALVLAAVMYDGRQDRRPAIERLAEMDASDRQGPEFVITDSNSPRGVTPSGVFRSGGPLGRVGSSGRSERGTLTPEDLGVYPRRKRRKRS